MNNKTKKHIIIIILIMISICIGVLFKSSRILKEDVKFKNQILEFINKSDSIDFNTITNFKWDNIYVFTPYSDPKDILKKDEIKSYNLDFNVKYLDSIYMMAFINENKIISFIELPKVCVDIDSKIPIKFSENHSKFTIYNKKIIFHKGTCKK